MLETDLFGPRSLTSLIHLKLWRRVKRWRTGKTAIPCGNDEWRWEQMKLRRRECWRRTDVLDIMFQVRRGKWGFGTRLTEGYLGWPDTHNLKLSPDSALQCVLQGSFRGGLFSHSFCPRTHTHTHTHTLSGIPSSLLKRFTICGGTLETLGLAFLTACD